MREDGLCPVCMLPIDKKKNLERILDEGYDELWTVGGSMGIDLPQEALDEQTQVLYHNGVHVDCFEKLE
jgi:hypothetical protein